MSSEPDRTRTAVCPSCRVLLDEGARCDADPRHAVVSLRDAKGRAALGRELWGGPQIRLRLTPEDKLLCFLALGLGVCIWAASSDTPGHIAAAITTRLDDTTLWLAMFLIPPLIFFARYILRLLEACIDVLVLLVSLIASGVVALVRLLTPGKKRPRGMFTIAPDQWNHRQLVGTIRADTSVISPVSGKRCIAHVVCLCTDEYFGGPILVGDATTAGFVLDLDDGSSIRVPPGRIWLQCEEEDTERIDDGAVVDTYVSTLSRELTDRRILPYDYVTEAMLVPGDRVSLRGETGAPGGGYREFHGRERRIVDVPHVRLLERSRTARQHTNVR